MLCNKSKFLVLLPLVLLTVAVRVSAQCIITIKAENKNVQLVDCDNNGYEIAPAWKPPVATANSGCGPINLVQTAGPTPGRQIPLQEYEITYTAMAVDINTKQLVQKPFTFLVSVQKDLEAPVLETLKEQVMDKNSLLPDFTKAVHASDNCTPTNAIRLTQIPVPGTKMNETTNSVILRATDLAGNNTETTIRVVIK